MKRRGKRDTTWDIPRSISFSRLHFMLYSGKSITFGTVCNSSNFIFGSSFHHSSKTACGNYNQYILLLMICPSLAIPSVFFTIHLIWLLILTPPSPPPRSKSPTGSSLPTPSPPAPLLTTTSLTSYQSILLPYSHLPFHQTLKGQCHEIFGQILFGLEDLTWAPCAQANMVSRNFSFSRRYSRKFAKNVRLHSRWLRGHVSA